jgi:hypothetical protein
MYEIVKTIHGDLGAALPADLEPRDLVTCGYVFSELAPAAGAALWGRLWTLSAERLVIVEAGSRPAEPASSPPATVSSRQEAREVYLPRRLVASRCGCLSARYRPAARGPRPCDPEPVPVGRHGSGEVVYTS